MAVEVANVSPADGGIVNAASPPDTPAGPQLASWNHTASGSNTLLVVCVGVGTVGAYGYSDANTVTVNFGASSLTSVAKVHTNSQTAGFIQLFALAGVVGTQSIAITVTGTYHTDIEAVAVGFTGVNQLAPFSASATNYGSGTTPNFASPIASGINDLVFAFQGNGHGTYQVSCSGTQRFSVTTGNVYTGCNSLGASTTPGGAPVSPTFSMDGTDWWATIGVNVSTMNEGTPPPVIHAPIARYYG